MAATEGRACMALATMLPLETPHPVWVAEHGAVGKPGASGSAEGPHKRRSERVLQQ